MALAAAVGLVFFFFTIFECSPVSYFWNQIQPTSKGKCVNPDILIGIAYLYSVGAAITDLTIGLLPVALIWNLRMNRRTKGAIVGILGIGCVFVLPSCLCSFDMMTNSNIPAVRVPRSLSESRLSTTTRMPNFYVCPFYPSVTKLVLAQFGKCD